MGQSGDGVGVAHRDKEMQGRGGGHGVWDDIDMSVIVGGGPIRRGESECPIKRYIVTKRRRRDGI